MPKQHLAAIEYIRGISMLGVIGIHVGSQYLRNPVSNAHLTALFEIATRFSVPIFFFISAFGIFYHIDLDKPFNYCQFLQKRSRAVVLPYLIWSLFYLIHDGWLYFPLSKFSNEYLYLYFKHIRDNLIALGNGSVFTNLKTDILKNYPTYLPTKDVLKEFDGLVQPIFSMILLKTREIKRLSEIRDTLLPKLMSGELYVSGIEL